MRSHKRLLSACVTLLVATIVGHVNTAAPSLMPWLRAKYNYFEIFSVFYFTCNRRIIDTRSLWRSVPSPLPSAREHPSYGDCLEVKKKYYQNSSVLDCVTQCSQSAAYTYLREQFLQVKQIGFVTLGPLCCA